MHLYIQLSLVNCSAQRQEISILLLCILMCPKRKRCGGHSFKPNQSSSKGKERKGKERGQSTIGICYLSKGAGGGGGQSLAWSFVCESHLSDFICFQFIFLGYCSSDLNPHITFCACGYHHSLQFAYLYFVGIVLFSHSFSPIYILYLTVTIIGVLGMQRSDHKGN